MQLVDWDDVPEIEPSDAWIAMPQNGWGALTVWCAGTGRVGRIAVSFAPIPSANVVSLEDRRLGAWGGLDPDAMSSMEESVNEYLRDAQVPPRPTGYAWCVLLPRSLEPEDFWPTVNARAGDLVSTAPRPDEWRTALTAVLSDLYADL